MSLQVRPAEFASAGNSWGQFDLNASVTTESAHTSVNLLIDTLDHMIRRRTTAINRWRHENDLREQAVDTTP